MPMWLSRNTPQTRSNPSVPGTEDAFCALPHFQRFGLALKTWRGRMPKNDRAHLARAKDRNQLGHHRVLQTKPLWALEMICRIAEPTTTKRKRARTTGPTVKGDFSFFEPLLTFPMFFSYFSDLRPVFLDTGILKVANAQ